MKVPRPSHEKKSEADVKIFRTTLAEFLKQNSESSPEKIHVVIGDGAGFYHKQGQSMVELDEWLKKRGYPQ